MGCNLHLIKPFGFEITDKRLKRAGLDYKELANVTEYENLQDYIARAKPERIFAVETGSSKKYSDVDYQSGDSFLFGPETKGLPEDVANQFNRVSLPMQNGSRSLNLANCVSIVAYEAWRQLDFVGSS